jgi:O-antigen ligase
MRKLFIVVLFLFILGETIRLNLGNGIILKPLDIGIGFVVTLWLILKLIKNEIIKQKRILFSILLFAGSGLFSLLFNYSYLAQDQFVISLMYLIRWIIYAGIFFLILDFNDKFKNKIIISLILIGSLIIGIGYVQYCFYSNLRNLYYLGWDEHMYRMFSIFLDPNFAGAFFTLFLLFLLNIFYKKKNILVGIVAVFTLGAVFLTFSRSALIMLIVSVCIFLTLIKKKKMILLLIGIIVFVLLITSRYFNIENINLFRIASSEARLETTKNALLIIGKNPILGVGFNAYRYAQFRYGFRNIINVSSHADASPDNSFLFVLATTGILGFCFYIIFWYRILEQVFRISPLFVASAFGVFIDSFFINSLFYPFIMLWLWIILALSIKNHN